MSELRTEYAVARKRFDGQVIEMTGPEVDVDDYLRVMAKRYPEKRPFLEKVTRRVSDWEPVYKTKTGKALTEAEIDGLAAEAERGYDVLELLKKGHVLGQTCPDGGKCHHDCEREQSCYRVQTCAPLSGVFPDDKWPTRSN